LGHRRAAFDAVTVQEFADALSIALAKRGARVRVRDSHSTSIYLLARYRDTTHSIRVSDHPPGKRWRKSKNSTSLDISKISRVEVAPEVAAAAIMDSLKNGH